MSCLVLSLHVLLELNMNSLKLPMLGRIIKVKLFSNIPLLYPLLIYEDCSYLSTHSKPIYEIKVVTETWIECDYVNHNHPSSWFHSVLCSIRLCPVYRRLNCFFCWMARVDMAILILVAKDSYLHFKGLTNLSIHSWLTWGFEGQIWFTWIIWVHLTCAASHSTKSGRIGADQVVSKVDMD